MNWEGQAGTRLSADWSPDPDVQGVGGGHSHPEQNKPSQSATKPWLKMNTVKTTKKSKILTEVRQQKRPTAALITPAASEETFSSTLGQQSPVPSSPSGGQVWAHPPAQA